MFCNKIVIYSVHILVINVKNSATCFDSLSHHQAKYKHSTGTCSECTVNSMGSHNVCTH